MAPKQLQQLQFLNLSTLLSFIGVLGDSNLEVSSEILGKWKGVLGAKFVISEVKTFTVTIIKVCTYHFYILYLLNITFIQKTTKLLNDITAIDEGEINAQTKTIFSNVLELSYDFSIYSRSLRSLLPVESSGKQFFFAVLQILVDVSLLLYDKVFIFE